MLCYTTYGEFQEQMNERYHRTGQRLQFPEMISRMQQKGLLYPEKPTFEFNSDVDLMTDEEFDALTDRIPMELNLEEVSSTRKNVFEEQLIPEARDVYVIRHPRFTRPYMHTHNYFEIDFMVSGQGTFFFEDEQRVMKAGEVCIVAPGSTHDFLIEDEKTICYTICIRKSTFANAFLRQMTKKNILSYFFQTVLQGDSSPNYLLFFTDNGALLKRTIRHALLESVMMDEYSNACAVAQMQFFFAMIVRTCSKTLKFQNDDIGADFTTILRYIQRHYQDLTLQDLARHFHYSEPYMSTLIKKSTGHTFSALIRELRLYDACQFLASSSLKISEIADAVGYNSADHFSRVFRSTYGISPQDYRTKHRKDAFVPFKADAAKND